MSYTFEINFHTDIGLNEFSKYCVEQGIHLQYSDTPGTNRTMISYDPVEAYSVLRYLKSGNQTEKLLVRDDDGWECEEIDLLGRDEIAALSKRLSSSDISNSSRSATNSVCSKKSEKSSGEDSETRCTVVQRPQRQLILASQSPRRQELLSLIDVPFTASAADIDEAFLTEELRQRFSKEPFSIMAALTVMNLAREKALKLLVSNPNAIVIGSDTIVTIDESILGKPSSEQDAFAMLKRLAGRDHHVFTGVSIISNELEETFFTVTRVGFNPWSNDEEALARKYIAGGSPMDKAGAYGIQDMGALFIRGVKGDYYTVMGMPVSEVYGRLKKFGIDGL